MHHARKKTQAVFPKSTIPCSGGEQESIGTGLSVQNLSYRAVQESEAVKKKLRLENLLRIRNAKETLDNEVESRPGVLGKLITEVLGG